MVLFSDLADAIDEKLHEDYKTYWIDFWMNKQQLAITEDHKDFKFYKRCWDKGVPFSGVTGAMFSYKLTPTSVGTEVEIRCNLTETKEKNPWISISADNW